MLGSTAVNILESPEKSVAPWISSEGPALAPSAAKHIQKWWERAQTAYPPNTRKAWAYDWAVFIGFCEALKVCPLPATAETVATFVAQCRIEGKKPATVRRYLSTVALAHRVAKLMNPCDDEVVQLEIKGLTSAVSVRQRQSRALGWAEIEHFLKSAGESLPATRERALVCVAYDTMARRSELVALDLEDFRFLTDGTGRALIRRSKTDQAGEGNTAYLSRTTVRYLKLWLDAADIKEGAVFRRVIGRGTVTTDSDGKGRIGETLSVDAIAQAFKRVAKWIKMPPEEVAQVSGHSIRVGATQDLLALNIDLGSVMQAGRWKTNRMPMRYGEHVLAARGGMGRAAQLQGRDEENLSSAEPRMKEKANHVSAPITLNELEQIITKSGGQSHARTYAKQLLAMVRVLETRGSYTGLLEPIRTARDQADLRGRLLELNLAYQFERAGVHPDVSAKQSGTGDIDFRFKVAGYEVYLETKLLRQSTSTSAKINSQLASSNAFGLGITDDTRDIARIHRDLIQKSNPRKFDAKPKANWVNLIGVDVSEVQLGMADLGDCLLAAGGNPIAAEYYHDAGRPNVVGFFERLSSMTPGQAAWVSELDALVESPVHPREYIHGAVFLFRKPKDTAALVHELTAAVVWNAALVTHEMARDLEPVIHQIVPRLKRKQ
jgi:integrase